MKILKVIHGYPMRYNAGSEVYSQTLCQGLAEGHEVHVFTREEDAFALDNRLRVETDPEDPRITVHIVNNPRNKDRYRVEGIDQRFAEVLERIEPDIVHVGHLNHLSTSLLQEAASRGIPIVYTLHDYWLMCPRGQFMQMFPRDPSVLWAACDGQEDQKCAERCYRRYFSGDPESYEEDVSYWRDWVNRRMEHVRDMTQLVDVFIAPAKYLLDRYRDDFSIPHKKLTYLDYGFDRRRLVNRERVPGEKFTFGYIGTHIPAKGIHDLIRAFSQLSGHPHLRIWGRDRGQDTKSLKEMGSSLDPSIARRIEWLSEYRNQDIVDDVFNRVDAIVVPSIWVENSPLVIHEAQQVRIPIITANTGGMAEYVQHEVNGLLFEHRSDSALLEQMQRFVDAPQFAKELGERAYLFSETGDIPGIETHVKAVEGIYDRVIQAKQPMIPQADTGPWRITFDTNPDTCNLHCIMCEEHSPFSPLQVQRKKEGRKPRIMPFDLIKKVVADAVLQGLREIIPSTMGEPLLYHNFEDIIGLCERYNVKLNLTTNGTFPRLGVEAWAKRLVPITSDVKISWNGASKATHEAIMLGSNWEKVLQNAKTFIQIRDAHAKKGGNRCRVTFQMTFLEDNLLELADMVSLAIDLGVDRLKGHHLWAHFDEIKAQSMRRDSAAIKRWNDAVLEAQKIAAERPLSNGQHILLDNIFLLDEEASKNISPGGRCPFLGEEVWVSATGRFDPCCAPDAQRRTLGEFGNLKETGLFDIWNGAGYQDLMKTYQNQTLCIGCNMRKPVESTP